MPVNPPVCVSKPTRTATVIAVDINTSRKGALDVAKEFNGDVHRADRLLDLGNRRSSGAMRAFSKWFITAAAMRRRQAWRGEADITAIADSPISGL